MCILLQTKMPAMTTTTSVIKSEQILRDSFTALRVYRKSRKQNGKISTVKMS